MAPKQLERGIDHSVSSLCICNYVGALCVRRFQDAGHPDRPWWVAQDSGRSEVERKLLDGEMIVRNVADIRHQRPVAETRRSR